jgi:two-component system, LytTR family, sensor histidine kinase AlgZ
MHPLLASGAALAIYAAGWVPLAVLLVYVLAASGNLGWAASVAIVAPSSLIYAVICLSPFYVVRTMPLRAAALGRILITNLAAAIASSLILVAVARSLAVLLARVGPALEPDWFSPLLDQRFRPHVPLLFGMGVLLYLLSVGMHYVMLQAQESRQALQREMQALVVARDAELKALKAQINPHFLFNSLNSISALTGIDAARAREMCVRLSDFLRSSLRMGERETVPLIEEVALARSYLAVEQVRFGERLRIEQHIAPECVDFPVPPLLLQPLVENAVKHGISSLAEGGLIRLEARLADRDLHLIVENPFDPEGSTARKNGLGLLIVKRRLLARYGDRAALATKTGDHHYQAEILVPRETGKENSFPE